MSTTIEKETSAAEVVATTTTTTVEQTVDTTTTTTTTVAAEQVVEQTTTDIPAQTEEVVEDDDDDELDFVPHHSENHHIAHSVTPSTRSNLENTVKIANAVLDSSKVVKRPTWTPTMHITIATLTKMFHVYKDNLYKARTVIAQTAMPKPIHVSIKKVYIPRRDEVLPIGMDSEKEKAGKGVKAEWIDFHKILDHGVASDRVIVYAHGGAYFMASRKTHRQVTWRLAKYAKARVLSIDYRMAPEAQFPAAIHDLLS
ncbi:hypothetical protein HDU76_010892, partial [Blyttiomyces sp. JEL0837]